MSTFSEAAVRQRASASVRSVKKSASVILKEEASAAKVDAFHVFLSHSSAEDKDIILGVKRILEEHDLSVYVDQFDDPQLSPTHVTKETAEILRARMRQSKSLLFLHSDKSTVSKWMPWELGFFDGLNGKVGVFPVTRNVQRTFQGQEYLALYPYVDGAKNIPGKDYLWIRESEDRYARFDLWLAGSADIKKHQ